MKNRFIWLDKYNFVYERVVFIPDGRIMASQCWYFIFKSDWKVIDSAIKDML